ncbi:hypothetical protein ABPG74_012151 [Tetrahymena malaccensis]
MELEKIKKQINGLQPQVFQALDQIFCQLNLGSRYEQLSYFVNNNNKLILLGNNKIQNIKVALEIFQLNAQDELKNQFKKENKIVQKLKKLRINECFFVNDFKLVEYYLEDYQFSQNEVKSEFINLVSRLQIQYQDKKDTQSILQIASKLNLATDLKQIATEFNKVENFELIDKTYIEISKLVSLNRLEIIFYECELDFQKLSEYLAPLLILENLDIKLNSIKVFPKDLHNFISGLEGFERLKSFNLYLDELHQDQSEEDKLNFLDCLYKLKHLENLEIQLFSCQLQPENCLPFSNLFSEENKLQSLKLNLYGNQIGSQGLCSISQGIQKLQNLKKLQLTFCYGQINDEGIVTLGNSLTLCNQIKYLYLHLQQNQIGNEGFIYLGEKISNLKCLTELEIFSSVNQINSEGLTLFTKSIMKCPNLISLTFGLSYNHFSVQAIQQSLQEILVNKRLIKVSLDYSNSEEVHNDTSALKYALKKIFLNKNCVEAEVFV